MLLYFRIACCFGVFLHAASGTAPTPPLCLLFRTLVVAVVVVFGVVVVVVAVGPWLISAAVAKTTCSSF